MQDPYFARSVIYLEEFNEDGALGFILNKPQSTPLHEAVTIEGIEIPNHIPTWYGGPVDTSIGVILKKGIDPLTHKTKVEIGTTKQDIKELIKVQNAIVEQLNKDEEGNSINDPFRQRFVVGYAGWGPEQLDREIKAGGWLLIPFDEDICFNTNWKNMWDKAMARLGVEASSLDPSLNPYLN